MVAKSIIDFSTIYFSTVFDKVFSAGMLFKPSEKLVEAE